MKTDRAVAQRLSRSLPAVGLWVLYAFTGVALVGYATFGLHPEMLARQPQAAGFYAHSFNFFAQAQIWLAAAVLLGYLAIRTGRAWLSAFCAVYVLSLASELLGTTVGLPFGEYRYTDALGAQWFDHVPVVIPLSWFFMALPSYAIARWILPQPRGTIARVFIASMILLSWDLALDPAMSGATAYWVWAEPGAYYGMPWLNLFGWYVTGLLLMGAMVALRVDAWVGKLSLPWLIGFYGANLVLPMGMTAAAGMWGAVAATSAALGVAGAAALGSSGRLRTQSDPAEMSEVVA